MDLDRAREVILVDIYNDATTEEQIAIDTLIKYAFRFENVQRTFKAMLENVDTLSVLCELENRDDGGV